jgi:hypothetical protein
MRVNIKAVHPQEYEYKDPAVVAQNIGFNQPRRLNKSYDKHAGYYGK